MNILNRKFFILGIVALILVTIPLTIYFIKKQQEVRSQAEASSTLSFIPSQKTDAHLEEDFSLVVEVNPGQNVVSVVRMQVKYDPTKLELKTATPSAPFTQTLEALTISSGNATVAFGIGADVTQAIQQTPTTVATLVFKPLATTGTTPTIISFENTDPNQTQVLSLSAADNPGENVLATTNTAAITILAAGVGPDTTPIVTATPTATLTPTRTPTPQPTSPPVATNALPICSSLGINNAASGTAPYSLTFTANGSDSDGTLSKATFSFGEGVAQDVTVGGGIGTATISAQASHSYSTAGTFQASATLTDDKGGA